MPGSAPGSTCVSPGGGLEGCNALLLAPLPIGRMSVALLGIAATSWGSESNRAPGSSCRGAAPGLGRVARLKPFGFHPLDIPVVSTQTLAEALARAELFLRPSSLSFTSRLANSRRSISRCRRGVDVKIRSSGLPRAKAGEEKQLPSARGICRIYRPQICEARGICTEGTGRHRGTPCASLPRGRAERCHSRGFRPLNFGQALLTSSVELK